MFYVHGQAKNNLLDQLCFDGYPFLVKILLVQAGDLLSDESLKWLEALNDL
jgi:hypothetical protein